MVMLVHHNNHIIISIFQWSDKSQTVLHIMQKEEYKKKCGDYLRITDQMIDITNICIIPEAEK